MSIYKYLFVISLINGLIVMILVGLGLYKSGDAEKMNNSGIERVIVRDATTLIPTKKSEIRCVITVDGNKYDVTEFKRLHSGGNIFVCGSDMSVTFHDQHTIKYLEQLTKYKIN